MEMQLSELTEHFLNNITDQSPDLQLQLPIPDSGAKFINSAAVGLLTDEIQGFIAEIVATLIDAGSEREAVLENEELRTAITKELNSWTEKEG
jgi:hypothetical protein